ncbi:MAG: sulfotransferase [Dongiaceae bacterium]
MRLKQEFYRLPFRFDAARLAEEALSFPPEAWRAHPSGYEGNTALILVSARGEQNDDLTGPMQPTEHLARAPYFRQVMAAFDTVIGRSRLMRLAPGATVSEHTDINYYWRSHFRIHVPIVTRPEVQFYCRNKPVHMAAGQAWTFDNWLMHKVVNPTEITRIHLVIDTVGTAALWRLLDRAAMGAVGERFVPFDPAADPVLKTERYANPPVPPPSEIDSLALELLADIRDNKSNEPAAVLTLAQAVDDLRHDWRCLWLVHGPAESGWPEYRACMRRFETTVGALPQLVVASNGMTAQSIANAQFAAAFAVDRKPEPARPAPPQPTAAPAAPSAAAVPAAPAPAAVPATAAATATAGAAEPAFERPVFVIAAPRSGSTLLFETLAENRDFWTVGDESHQLIEGIQGLHPAQRGFDSNRLTAADATPPVAAALRRGFAGNLRNNAGVPWRDLEESAKAAPLRFLEKTPKNALRIPFLAAVFPDACFIYLHRNPRDNVSSLLDSWRSGRFVTYPALPGWSGQAWSHLLIPGWRELAGKELAEIVSRQWQATNETILADLEAVPRARWTTVSYEAFTGDTPLELRRLCEFAGVPYGPRMDEIARRPLKQSRYTLTAPSAEKWRRNAGELAAVLGGLEPLADRLRKLQPAAAPALA